MLKLTSAEVALLCQVERGPKRGAARAQKLAAILDTEAAKLPSTDLDRRANPLKPSVFSVLKKINAPKGAKSTS